MTTIHVTNNNFNKEVLEHKGTVFVDFYAEWCGPCKMTSPIIEELSNEITDVKFVKIDVDTNPEISGEYSIFSIPTFIIFKDGNIVDTFTGVQSKDNFKKRLST